MHARTIIGYRRNGCPIWLIQGASEPAPEPTPEEPKGYTAPATQADLDRIIGERVAREKAKYAGFSDMKVKADQFDQLQEKNKSDLQRESERAAAAEQRAVQAELKALRAEVAETKKVPSNLISGTTKEEMEASADALLAFRGEQKPPAGPVGLTPGQEKKKTAGEDGRAEAARRFNKT